MALEDTVAPVTPSTGHLRYSAAADTRRLRVSDNLGIRNEAFLCVDRKGNGNVSSEAFCGRAGSFLSCVICKNGAAQQCRTRSGNSCSRYAFQE